LTCKEIATRKCNVLSYRVDSSLEMITTADNATRDATPSVVGSGSHDRDIATIHRVLAGDVNAFEEIVLRWQTPIINMAWRYTRDRSLAEELAQEAFIRAWRALPQFRCDSSFSTWLFALAANHFRNHLKRYPVQTLPLEEAPEPSAPATALFAIEDSQRTEQIRRAVLALPHLYREPMVLFYFHEMDLALTASTLKIPEGTLKARLARGRELLKRRFPTLAALNEGQQADQSTHLRESSRAFL
jgi:RNA polymerase sigma-70 factor (ECF subfamily)